jgi:hypothetical protein
MAPPLPFVYLGKKLEAGNGKPTSDAAKKCSSFARE